MKYVKFIGIPMASTNPAMIALQFNEFINQQNIQGLTSLMTDDHRFIDRAGLVVNGKTNMLDAWVRFFELYPEYRNTFTRVESNGNLVILYGYATWNKGDAPDHAIWTATVEDDLVAVWRIHEDTEENRKNLELLE
jgi:predicted SnoaL-like aldol condensation-catalyzing enzyme